MDYDKNKVDDAALALLYLTMFEEHNVVHAWKSFDWDTMNRLHEKNFIGNPKNKAKSIVLTEKGAKRATELFEELFGQKNKNQSQGN